MGKLDGKVAFITGAARGQGRSHAIRLAEEGADVVLVDICAPIEAVPYDLASAEELEETADEVRALGRKAVARVVDVRNFDALRDAADAGLAELGTYDIVIANAGISTLSAFIQNVTLEEAWEATLGVNLTGVWNTVRATVPSMMERNDGGAIVMTSSTAGLKGLGAPGHIGNEAYGASKHGVVGLMRTFAMELAPFNIRVNSVHPTGVNTQMIMNPAMEKFLGEFPDAVGALTNMLPVEVIEPVDVTEAILFLVSDVARYITGVTFPVDAGFNAK